MILTTGQRFFSFMYQFHCLRIPERLHLMPHSAHAILQMLMDRETNHLPDPCLNAKCMAQHIGVTPPMVSRTIRHLRERGLIIVEPDPYDRREIRMRLTSDGRQALQEDQQRLDTLMNRAMAHLPSDEAEQFLSVFSQMLNNLKEEIEKMPDPDFHFTHKRRP